MPWSSYLEFLPASYVGIRGILEPFNILYKSLCLLAVLWGEHYSFHQILKGVLRGVDGIFLLISISGYTYAFFCISMIFLFIH